MNALDLNRVHNKVSKLLVRSDEIVNQYFAKGNIVNYKAGLFIDTALVSKADLEIEKFLRVNLHELYPQIGFIGEEGKEVSIKKYNWIIDPIDGTLNFTRGIPIFTTSIALWRENVPIYGAISLPKIGGLIHAFKDGGLFFNNKLVKRFKKTRKELACPIITYAQVGSLIERASVLNEVGKAIGASVPRLYGSISYHGALLALGKVEGLVVIKTSLWDLAAIVLLAREAGLYTEFITPKPSIYDKNLKGYKHSLVMGGKGLVQKIVNQLKKLDI